MKKKIIYAAAAAALLAPSCELLKVDNYDAPDSGIYGYIYDKQTGEPLGSDVVNGATVLTKQLDWTSDVIGNIYVRVDSDGKYENNSFFKGTYMVQPYLRNFIENTPDTIKVDGKTRHDFHVTPYIRISESSIALQDQTVKATFKLKNNMQTSGKAISKIALFMSQESQVSTTIRNAASKVISFESDVEDDEVVNLSINLTMHESDLKLGQDYYFRIGALSETTGAKYNYSPSVKITLPSKLKPEVLDGVLISNCEAKSVSGVGAWSGNPDATAYGFDFTQGDYSIQLKSLGTATPRAQYLSQKPIDTGASVLDGVLKFDLFVSDIECLNKTNNAGQIELTSSGKADQNEYHWLVRNLDIQSGWNEVSLPFNVAETTNGSPDLAAINFFRIYLDGTYPIGFYLLIDNVRVCVNE